MLGVRLLVNLVGLSEQIIQNFHLNARKTGAATGGGRGDRYNKTEHTGHEVKVTCGGTVHQADKWQTV